MAICTIVIKLCLHLDLKHKYKYIPEIGIQGYYHYKLHIVLHTERIIRQTVHINFVFTGNPYHMKLSIYYSGGVMVIGNCN